MSCMNRKVVFLVISICILTFAVLPAAFSDVEENFEPAGMVLGGSVSFTYDFGYPFADYGTNTTWMSIGINPIFGMFLVKNLSLQIYPSFYYYQNSSDGEVVYRYAQIGLGSGVMYYLSSLEPIVPAFGMDLTFWYQPEGDYTSNYFELGLRPKVYMYFFAGDRVAPYAGLVTNFFLTDLGDFYGGANIKVRTSVALGIAVFLPNAISPVD